MDLGKILREREALVAQVDPSARQAISNIVGPGVVRISQSKFDSVSSKTAQLEAACNQIYRHLVEYQQCYQEAIDDLTREADKWRQQYIDLSEELYRGIRQSDTPEHILAHRKLNLGYESTSFLQGRIQLLTDWKMPGMLIRPGADVFIRSMVAVDPLYIADNHVDLLQPSIKQFNKKYQNRICQYVLDDEVHHPLARMPENQYGMIFCVNFLQYKSLDVIERYIRDFYTALAPGGVACVAFTDCDRSGGAEQIERFSMCYCSQDWMRSIATALGFDVGNPYWLDNANTYLELVKPGETHSLRGGQATAKIMPVVDKPEEKVYNEKERKRIIKTAKNLGIPDWKNLKLSALDEIIQERNRN